MFEMKKKVKWHQLKMYSTLKKKVQILSIHLNPYILVLIIFRIPSSSKFHPGLGKNGSEHRPATALPMHLWSLGSCLKRNKPSMKTQWRLNTSKSLIQDMGVGLYWLHQVLHQAQNAIKFTEKNEFTETTPNLICLVFTISVYLVINRISKRSVTKLNKAPKHW